MARPREFDESEALRTLKGVFWRKGFEGASYAELMEATGLGKGSLYAAFGDKRALFLRALAAYVETEVESAVDLLEGRADGGAKSALNRIGQFMSGPIDAVYERGDRSGCFLCNAAVELGGERDDVANRYGGRHERIAGGPRFSGCGSGRR